MPIKADPCAGDQIPDIFLPYTKPCIARLRDDEADPLDAEDVAALLEEEEAAKEMAVLPVEVEAACWT
jgi:hypothetical protein